MEIVQNYHKSAVKQYCSEGVGLEYSWANLKKKKHTSKEMEWMEKEQVEWMKPSGCLLEIDGNCYKSLFQSSSWDYILELDRCDSCKLHFNMPTISFNLSAYADLNDSQLLETAPIQ